MPAVSGNINLVTGFSASAVTATSTNTLTLTFGSTAIKDSIIFVGATGNGGTGAWTGPSGYTELPSSALYATSTRQTRVWAKIATGSETTATVTGTGTTTGIAMACMAFTGVQVSAFGLSTTLSRNYGGSTGAGVTGISFTNAGVKYWSSVADAPILAVLFFGANATLASATIGSGTGWSNNTTTSATGISNTGSTAIVAGYSSYDTPSGTDGVVIFGASRSTGGLAVALYPNNGQLSALGVGA